MPDCPGCKIKPRVYPYHCYCGKVHEGKSRPSKTRPRTVGTALQELVGCGCNLPLRTWDRRGLDWCRDNAEGIAQRLTREPKPGLSAERAAEMVQLAIEVAERATEQ